MASRWERGRQVSHVRPSPRPPLRPSPRPGSLDVKNELSSVSKRNPSRHHAAGHAHLVAIRGLLLLAPDAGKLGNNLANRAKLWLTGSCHTGLVGRAACWAGAGLSSFFS